MIAKNPRGFTLIELLVVISIIAVLSVVGTVQFIGIRNRALDAKIKGDINAIKKAYEANYDPTENGGQGGYKTLAVTQFADGKIPTPDGTTNTSYPCPVGPGCASPNVQGYLVTATLSDGTTYKAISNQGTYPAEQLNSCDPAGSLSNGLVGYWKFNETTGTTAVDSSNYRQNLYVNSAPAMWQSGKFGNAYYDVGNPYPNQKAAYGSWTAPVQTDFSVSVWVNPSSTAPTTSGYIVARWWGDCSTSYQPGWALRYITAARTVTFQIAADSCGPDGRLTSPAIPTNAWTHIVATHKTGDKIKLYLNGNLNNSLNYTLGLNPTPPRLSFGCNSNNNECGFPGLTDDARIYSRVLSDSEVANLYNSGNGCIP